MAYIYEKLMAETSTYYLSYALMAAPVGLEPTTLRLTAACSTY